MTERSVARERERPDAGSGVVEVHVRAIASGGDGVAELPDGRVVFVPRTAPGDRALVRVEESRASWARASKVELLQEGELRVDAPCPLFDRCGGCQLQHLPYAEQLTWKGRFVVDALERIGKCSDVPEPEVVPSPKTRGYRTRMTFTLRRLRGGRIVAGLHALDNPSHVIDIDDECLLPRSDVSETWARLRESWGGGARRLPSGGRLRLTLREAPGGVALVVDGGEAGWRSGGLMDDLPELVAIWHRASGADETALVAGESTPGGGDAFEQVNPECAELLRRHVLEVARSSVKRRSAEGATAEPSSVGPPEDAADAAVVVEGYCGTAPLGKALAAEGVRVTGIERNASAVAAARLDAPPRFRAVEGTVEGHLAAELPADLLVVNPPRTGLTDAVPGIVLAEAPPRVVYVSCDPATLARDVARLSAGYELTGVRCFDLFPHTAHIETVAVLDRPQGAA